MTAAVDALAVLGANAMGDAIDAEVDAVGGDDATRAAVLRQFRATGRSNARETPAASASAIYRLGARPITRPQLLTPDELDDLRLLLQTDHLSELVSLLESYDAAFGEALLDTYRTAAAEGLAPAAYREQIQQVASRWGAGDFAAGDIASTWAGSVVQAPAAHAGTILTWRVEEVASAWPYVEILTRDDERVRPNHRTLHGLIVAVTWEGMPEVLPPYGYNCRCKPFRRTRDELEARFGALSEGAFPLGSAKLDAFRAAGGPDEGFPRSLFVLAA